MKRKNNHSTLPFYDDIKYQNQNDWYAYGQLYSYNYIKGYVPPFQFIIEDDTHPTGVLPHSFFDLVAIYPTGYPIGFDIASTMITDQGLTAEKFDEGYIIVKNNSTGPIYLQDWNPLSLPGISSSTPQGNVYLSLEMNNTLYYSEIFSWRDSLESQIKMTWSHEEDMLLSYGHIDYNTFEHIFYIKSSIGKPEYLSEEDVVRRDGYVYPINQTSYKMFKFEFFAAEYVTDMLRLIRMHDNVSIESDGVTYDVDEILFNVEWQKQGNIAKVVCEFRCDTVVVITGRATEP